MSEQTTERSKQEAGSNSDASDGRNHSKDADSIPSSARDHVSVVLSVEL